MSDIDPRDCADGLADTEQNMIETLRQQLAEAEALRVCADHDANELAKQLAESQAREYDLMEPLALCLIEIDISFETRQRIKKALTMPSDSTALDSAIRQAKREALLEAAGQLYKSDYRNGWKELPLCPCTSAKTIPDAHELWAAAQLANGEVIEDGVARIEAMLSTAPKGE